MKNHIHMYIKHIVPDVNFSYRETLQKLWSNYGEIARYVDSETQRSIIVKYINPPNENNHPKGWNSSVGHNRKVKSYQVESAFYQHYAGKCDVNCYVPQFIQANQISTVEQVLIMEDLTTNGYPIIKTSLTLDEVKSVIRWLAYFHAKFLNWDADTLWNKCCYWHLDTRQDEFNAMPSSELKSKASAINKKLITASYKTLVHGDAKLANFCFGALPNQVAAVDFQYVGKGVGVEDLQYFLGSCLSEAQLCKYHDELLNEYFEQLTQAISFYKKECNIVELEAQWRNLYCYACADFERFLQGWSPEHYKLNGYLAMQTKQCLNSIDF